jgi:SMP-30/Gluconolactonase/LRE-like region
MSRLLSGAAMLASLMLLYTGPAGAWDRGKVKNFATVPAFSPNSGACPNKGASSCVSGIEGLCIGPDGTVYTPSFGFNNAGPLTGNSELFVFRPDGSLVKHFPILGSSPHLIGCAVQSTRGMGQQVLIADLGLGVVWQVNPATQVTINFMTAPSLAGGTPGLNALTFDKSGNVYVSDSFQGAIWMTGPSGGTPTAWYAPSNPGQNTLLLPTAGPGEVLIPPFGANGIEFNNKGDAMYVMNTAYHSIVKIPVNNGLAGTGVTFTTGINAPDGLAVDGEDNLWVLANQGDEVVVVDPNGKVIAKKGDFNGLTEDGSINGLLFPASTAFTPDGKSLLVSNLALYLPFAGVPSIAVDSGWTLQVKHYNIAQIDVKDVKDAK